MPVTGVLLVALIAAALTLTSAVAHSQECETVTQPNEDPPPSEITVIVSCPDDGETGSSPGSGTPVGGDGGGDDGPSCSPLGAGEDGTPGAGDAYDVREDGSMWQEWPFECSDGRTRFFPRCMAFCPDGVEEAGVDWQARVDQLLLDATASLDLPRPGLRHLYDSAPDGRVLGVVRAETWWWTETSGPVTAGAEDGPLRVEVTAFPDGLMVDPGDGAPIVSCPDGGTAYDFSRSYNDQQGGSECIHVYQRTSADQPDEAFTVTATLGWQATWSATGPISATGTLPAAATSQSFPLPVGELQSVVSR